MWPLLPPLLRHHTSRPETLTPAGARTHAALDRRAPHMPLHVPLCSDDLSPSSTWHPPLCVCVPFRTHRLHFTELAISAADTFACISPSSFCGKGIGDLH